MNSRQKQAYESIRKYDWVNFACLNATKNWIQSSGNNNITIELSIIIDFELKSVDTKRWITYNIQCIFNIQLFFLFYIPHTYMYIHFEISWIIDYFMNYYFFSWDDNFILTYNCFIFIFLLSSMNPWSFVNKQCDEHVY